MGQEEVTKLSYLKHFKIARCCKNTSFFARKSRNTIRIHVSRVETFSLILFQTNGQCNSFNNMEQLKSRPAHLAAFLHHVISQFDAAPVVRRQLPRTVLYSSPVRPGGRRRSLLIHLNCSSLAVLPLCWLLQADQLQRDQTGVHGPAHLFHWPWSSKCRYLFPTVKYGQHYTSDSNTSSSVTQDAHSTSPMLITLSTAPTSVVLVYKSENNLKTS